MSRLADIVSQCRPSLGQYEELYKHLHRNPELSYQEAETSKLIAATLRGFQGKDQKTYTVHENIGGFGLVGILKNGSGPTVMLRADMDALPVKEQTGLPYASVKNVIDANSKEQCVMHACGHDMHISSLLACAETLLNALSHWSGTLLLAFQPAEEKGTGAQAMVDDGLYDPARHAIPIPDVVFGAHVVSHRSGTVSSRVGLMAGAAKNYFVTLQGRSSHASQPDKGIDPVVMAAYATTRLQTLISREANPEELTALSVSSIQAGEVENIIPQEALMKIDMRSSSNGALKKLEEGMKRIITAETQASAAAQPPSFVMTRSFPVSWNATAESKILFKAFQDYFGESFSSQIKPIGMSEDFGILGTSVQRPTVMWVYGGTEPEFYDKMVKEGRAEEIPSNHSAFFAPVIQPTLQRAIDGYTLCALACMSHTTLS